MSERTHFDLHQTLTNQIVAAIERVSADDFRLPWRRSGMSSIQPKNALTKNAYRDINIVSLWVAAEVHQYPHALWGTYKQSRPMRRLSASAISFESRASPPRLAEESSAPNNGAVLAWDCSVLLSAFLDNALR